MSERRRRRARRGRPRADRDCPPASTARRESAEPGPADGPPLPAPPPGHGRAGDRLLVIALLAIFAPLVAAHDPNDIDLRARNQGPSGDHWFGTDRTGRDTFARVVYAGRVSLAVGVVGGRDLGRGRRRCSGALAGFFGGRVDSLIMRFTDVMMTFPPIVIILTLAAIAGPGVGNTMLVIGLLNWPVPAGWSAPSS